MVELSEQLQLLHDEGFVLLPDIIPSGALEAIRGSVLSATEAARNPTAPAAIGHVPGLLRHDQSLAPWLAHPAVLDLVTAVLGPHARISFTTGQTNYPGCERQEWHAGERAGRCGLEVRCATL